jgi:hypothetical protein
MTIKNNVFLNLFSTIKLYLLLNMIFFRQICLKMGFLYNVVFQYVIP